MQFAYIGLLMIFIGTTTITANYTFVNNTLSVPQDPNCANPLPIANKFFVLSDLLFFTSNGDHFESFRVMNLSSGVSTSELQVANVLPVSTSQSLLWAFLFDPIICRLAKNTSEQQHMIFFSDRYCARMINLRGLIVARLINQTVLFLRSNNGKFTSTSDSVHYIEMSAVLKHIDKSGFTSSLTFDQQSNQYLSTHYGRYDQICITTVHQKEYILPLPIISELLSDHLFATKCIPSQRSYTSVVDLHGALFAITRTGIADQITNQNGIFMVKSSVNDKEFFNCYQKSPAVMKDHYNPEVDLLLENKAQWNFHAEVVVKQQIMERAIEDKKEESANGVADRFSDSHFWCLMAITLSMGTIFLALLIYFGLGHIEYIIYNDDLVPMSLPLYKKKKSSTDSSTSTLKLDNSNVVNQKLLVASSPKVPSPTKYSSSEEEVNILLSNQSV